MRTVVWLVLLFTVAVVAALALGQNDGLASFYWNGWRLDVSLNLFLLALVGTCFALVTAIQTIGALTSLPRRAHEWRLAQRERGAQLALRDALAEFFGARYGRAQKAAQRALSIHAQTPELQQDEGFLALGHLLSASSAHRLQDKRRRDEQLQLALDAAKRSPQGRAQEEGARLLAAEWALDDRDAPRALSLLAELSPGVARRTQALRLKLQASRLAKQPLEALRTARLLAKHQGFSKVAAQGLLRSLAFEALDAARDADQLRAVWQQLDSADRRDVFVAARAAQRAGALGVPDDGRGWLRPFWDDVAELGADERATLAEALVLVLPGLGPEWLQRLESAVQRFPRDRAFSYALGHALAERQLWGKARLILEQVADESSLAVAARRRSWLMLARLAEQDGDLERRARCHESAALVQ
ncbi:heme biosynthesis HemY N-terminal domain-containing protein [Paucibacter sp. DJ2R-2]|uniref:heme biosynthesis HemY N-terminal domain-containing protein n=1 Tax=Paucibacter sp. DJ2R-2 TaxID=2893558 RepID=UPI0021E4050A|nr:heme biosynthesis HemY N-terminal domain-containing protein [Paucibacter sp. DJ2R-2]MCV2422628.1 heme biosynthesis protein HemY [Paucibacter sp. DJ4R-1]MCV2438826.1 heme biosynthesis protein HemY [Paucibacter sp. DJ2R-2]